ncbi:MAG: ribosome small subunit-dependent GTPase A [Flavobacteriaceae bacterium]|nr:ribosome small subunit-dependent GTPase A [Flavobacteriaceae bacterium]
MQGLVIKSTGSWYVVKTRDEIVNCRIKGKFRIQGIKNTNPVTVGDIVDIEMEENANTGIINNIYNRRNYIIRKSVNLSKQTHIIASNIDQVFLLITIDNPRTFTGFVDRFLASARAYKIPVILLFNKIDSYNKECIEIKEKLKGIYSKIGYLCLDISATKKINIEPLKVLMQSKVSLFAGHSGVGKSTLVNTIYPKLQLKTEEISKHKQGKHTTTFAEMFALPFGGYIIDTPGIKGFGVVDFEKDEVGDYFIEFFKLKQYCKFNNCLHLKEPKCAIKKAVENGEIATSRYRNYLQIINGKSEHYRVSDFEF